MAQGVQVDESVQELLGEEDSLIQCENDMEFNKIYSIIKSLRLGWLSAHAPQHLPNRLEEPERVDEAFATRSCGRTSDIDLIERLNHIMYTRRV